MSSRAPGAAAGFEPPEEFDDYVILRRLGQGATGQVYLAEDTVLARPIAIKFIGRWSTEQLRALSSTSRCMAR